MTCKNQTKPKINHCYSNPVSKGNLLASIKVNKLEWTEHKSGKINGFISTSTSTQLNDFCQKMQTFDNTSCSQCYAESMSKMYKALEAKLRRNQFIATQELQDHEIKVVENKFLAIRFNAFGEIQSEQHFRNLIKISLKNPHKVSGLWTKRKDIVQKVLRTTEKPFNMVLLYSSPRLNANPKVVPEFFDKVFTVQDEDGINEVNCQQECQNCMMCYDLDNDVKFVYEQLKTKKSKKTLAKEKAKRDAIKAEGETPRTNYLITIDGTEEIIETFVGMKRQISKQVRSENPNSKVLVEEV